MGNVKTIIIPNVRFNGQVVPVTFKADKAKHKVTAKARGQNQIKVAKRKDGRKGFEASVRHDGDRMTVVASSPQKAFSKAVKSAWH